MPRLAARRTAALLRRFARARRGATAVEFAIISIPLMLLMFGILELGLILLVTSTLDTATDFAARHIRTGRFQTTGAVTRSDFEELVCRNMTWLQNGCAGKMVVEAETFDTYTAAGNSTPPPAEEFDPEAGCWSIGNPEDIVLVRTYFSWPVITPLLRPIFQNDGNGGRLLSSARIFRNEPYNPGLKPVGAKCS